MSPDTTFKFVEVVQGIVTYGLAASLFFLKRPASRVLRGLLAVLAAWLADVICTIHVYNPAGIAAGHYDGVHLPEGTYDNNTIAVALIGGWIGPAIILAIMGAFQSIRENAGLRPTERAPDTSPERTRDR